MISQFRSLNPLNLFLLAVITCVLRIGVLVQLPPAVDLLLFDTYGRMLVDVPANMFSPFGNVFLATVIVYTQAIILNRIINNYNLLGKPTFLPALMFVTITAIVEPFIVLSPPLLVNFLLLWMLDKMLSLYRRDFAISVMFDLGMMVALGTIIYFPFIMMMPMLAFVLLMYRPFYWREWLAAIVGFITIALMVCTLFFLNDKLNFFFATIPSAVVMHLGFKVSMYDFISLVPVIIILFFAFLSIRERYFRSNVFLRKASFLLVLVTLFGVLSFSINRNYDVYHFLLTASPLAVIMAYYFANATKKWFFESLYWLLAIFVLYFQFI